MRVLQINAVYKTKSTGRIAMELHQYFSQHGIDSYVAYGTENIDSEADPHVFQIGSTFDHKLHALQYRIDHLQGCHSTIATKQFLRKVAELKPDVVLTHNLHSNYLNVPVLLKGLKDQEIKVALALHDCWFMTGGCYHYTATNCKGWLNGCVDCSKLGNAAKKKFKMNMETFDYVHPMIIATSKWIEREAHKSLLSGRTDIRMIYDWVDRKSFFPRDATAIRNKYDIGDSTLILGVATGWGPDKGQNEMIEVAKAMPDAIVMLVGNQTTKVEYPDNVKTIAFTDSKDELAELYSAADVFFNPSKQETFGLTSGEALACGTPLVVYNTTACPEFATEYTGVVMEKGSDAVVAVKTMLEKNVRYGRDKVRKSCCEFVEDNFSMETNIDKYINLFQKMMER